MNGICKTSMLATAVLLGSLLLPGVSMAGVTAPDTKSSNITQNGTTYTQTGSKGFMTWNGQLAVSGGSTLLLKSSSANAIQVDVVKSGGVNVSGGSGIQTSGVTALFVSPAGYTISGGSTVGAGVFLTNFTAPSASGLSNWQGGNTLVLQGGSKISNPCGSDCGSTLKSLSSIINMSGISFPSGSVYAPSGTTSLPTNSLIYYGSAPVSNSTASLASSTSSTVTHVVVPVAPKIVLPTPVVAPVNMSGTVQAASFTTAVLAPKISAPSTSAPAPAVPAPAPAVPSTSAPASAPTAPSTLAPPEAPTAPSNAPDDTKKKDNGNQGAIWWGVPNQ